MSGESALGASALREDSRFLSRPMAFVRALWAEDRVVSRIACVFALVQVAGSLWDLPGNHGWENDGIAPLGLFSGLASSLAPGSANRYPLLHYVISLVAAIPALLLVPILSPSWAKRDLSATATSSVVMTGVSIGVKLVSIAMSTLTLLLLARYARRTSGDRAAVWTALFFTVNLSLSYYGRVSNLDGPYLFWSALALDRLAYLRVLPSASNYRLLGVFAAAAMATKDQAYSVVFPLLAVAAWQHRRGALQMAGGFFGAYVVLSGALINPTGFVARIRLLTGPNSQDWQVYEAGWSGFRRNVLDLAASVPAWWWPLPVLVLALLGLGWAIHAARRQGRIDALVPSIMAVGSLALFTLVVRRAEHRFLLPSALAATYYAGLGASALGSWSLRRNVAFMAVRGILLLSFASAALPCVALLFTQWGDTRRAVAAWLSAQPAGTTVETYGLPVYQPHFESDARYAVWRLQPSTTKPWAVLPGVSQREGRYQELTLRRPDVVVVTEGFASRYLGRPLLPGQRLSTHEQRALADGDAVSFFRQITQGGWPGYRVALGAEPTLPHWLAALGFTPVQVHGSTGLRSWLLVREDFSAGVP